MDVGEGELDVVAVRPPKRPGPDPGRRRLEQLVGEQDVDVGGQHGLRGGPSDADVLRQHLQHGHARPAHERPVDLGRHRQDPGGEARGGRRPPQHVGQRRTLRRWVPLDEHQLDLDAAAAGVPGEPVDEPLHPLVQIAAVVVVARRGDDAERGRHLGSAPPTSSSPVAPSPAAPGGPGGTCAGAGGASGSSIHGLMSTPAIMT